MANKKKLLLYLLTFLLLLAAALLFLFQNKLLGNKKINYSVLENKESENTAGTVPINEDNNSDLENEEAIINNSEVKKEENAANDSSENDNSLSLKIINKIVSWGYKPASGRKTDTIIIHSSYDALGSDPYSVSGLLNEYKQYGVAPHYLIDRKGNIYKLVEEKNIAYHAGESQTPDGRMGVNNFSIGIELMNKENSKFTSEQYSALNKLLSDVKSRYKIKYILGHNQIAPGRKTDPWNFDWSKINK